ICIYFFLGKTDKCSRQIRKQAFKLQTPYERFFAFFPFADIPEDPTSADDLALTISYRRNRDGNIDLLPLFRGTNRFVTLNMFAIFNSPLYVLRFIMTTVGNNYFDRLSYCFGFRIAEESLRALIPTYDTSIERRGDDGIISRLNNRCVPQLLFFG